MAETLFEIIPFIIGSALAPLQIIIILNFLKTAQGGLAKAVLFYLGITTIRLLQGVLFGLILDVGGSTSDANGKGPVVSTLLLVLGILLLITAYKKIKKEPDPEDEPPKWMVSLGTATNAKAFTFGLQLPLMAPKMWVFMLGTIGTIAYNQLGLPTAIYAFLLFILLAQLLLLTPIIIRLLLKEKSLPIFEAASGWVANNSNTIMIVVSLVFGVYFFYQGFYGLFLY